MPMDELENARHAVATAVVRNPTRVEELRIVLMGDRGVRADLREEVYAMFDAVERHETVGEACAALEDTHPDMARVLRAVNRRSLK